MDGSLNSLSSSLFTAFFNCLSLPLKTSPEPSTLHTLIKCILHCCFYEHQLLCSEPSLLTQKGSVPGSSDT